MPPDLVGVVIPAYIGALSSLAGVVVAIVALVTARRARADARAAAVAGDRVAERETVTRGAIVELTLIAQQIVADARAAGAAPAPVSAPRSDDAAASAVGGIRMPSRGSRRDAGGPRRRSDRGSARFRSIQDAVDRRPYWARSGSPRVSRPAGTGPPSVVPTVMATAAADVGPASDVSRRLEDLVRRLSDEA